MVWILHFHCCGLGPIVSWQIEITQFNPIVQSGTIRLFNPEQSDCSDGARKWRTPGTGSPEKLPPAVFFRMIIECPVSDKSRIRNSLSRNSSFPLNPGQFLKFEFSSVQLSSVAQSCPTLCDPMNRSTPGLPVHHQVLESTQTHVHCVGDAIQPSHPLSSPSPPALNLSQHQGLLKWVSSLHQVAKALEFQLQN